MEPSNCRFPSCWVSAHQKWIEVHGTRYIQDWRGKGWAFENFKSFQNRDWSRCEVRKSEETKHRKRNTMWKIRGSGLEANMPCHLAPPLLGAISARAVAKLLLKGCQALDRRSVGQLCNEMWSGCSSSWIFNEVLSFMLARWEEPEEPPCLSPPRPPGSPPRPALPREQVLQESRKRSEIPYKRHLFFCITLFSGWCYIAPWAATIACMAQESPRSCCWAGTDQ